MNIECEKNILLEGISKAEKISSKNTSLPILSCILLETKKGNLFIRATNLDLGIEISIPAKIKEEGSVAISGSILASFLSNLSQSDTKLILIKEKENLKVISKFSETTIKCQPTEDFPIIPHIEEGDKVEVYAKDLVLGMKSVWYAASNSSIKPELSSVYLYSNNKELIFVSTDSFRLAEKRIETKKSVDIPGLIIPIKNISEIIRAIDSIDEEVEITFDKNQISISGDGIFLVSRITDGNFPDYKKIIPKESLTEVLVLKNDLIQGLKVSGVFSDSFNQVSMVIDPQNSMYEIFSKNADKGESRNMIKATVKGERVEVNLNQRYLSDCFASIDSDSVTLNFNGGGKPLVIHGSKDSSFLYLVMPMNK